MFLVYNGVVLQSLPIHGKFDKVILTRNDINRPVLVSVNWFKSHRCVAILAKWQWGGAQQLEIMTKPDGKQWVWKWTQFLTSCVPLITNYYEVRGYPKNVWQILKIIVFIVSLTVSPLLLQSDHHFHCVIASVTVVVALVFFAIILIVTISPTLILCMSHLKLDFKFSLLHFWVFDEELRIQLSHLVGWNICFSTQQGLK